jgi:transcriptional regulator with XRE-family HTH domain
MNEVVIAMNATLTTIRARKLGVLIRDARLASGKSLEATAQGSGIPAPSLENYELGESSPSLPELELLAMLLNVPLDHFWGQKIISERSSPLAGVNLEQLAGLRQRKIGILLRQARLNADLELEEVATRVGVSAGELEAFEFGEAPIPIPHLEAISAALNRPLEDFMDKNGPVGAWLSNRHHTQDFTKLSPELQKFVCKPVNRPYLEIAQRLSELSVDKLRAVAEVLLEITL